MLIHWTDLDGLSALRIETLGADLKFVHSVDVRFDRRHHNVGIGALPVHDPAILLQPDAHFTLGIRPGGNCINRVQHQIARTWYDRLDRFKCRINQSITFRPA